MFKSGQTRRSRIESSTAPSHWQPKAGLANSKAADYLDQTRFGGRLAMAQKMNASYLNQYDQKQVRAYSDLYKDAIKLMRSEDLKAFDITMEPDQMHELYGTRTSVKVACLREG